MAKKCRKKSSTQSSKPYRTWQSVAQALGVSRNALLKLRRDPEFPLESVPASERQVERVRQWRAARLQPDRAHPDDGADADAAAEAEGEAEVDGKSMKDVELALKRERARHERLKRQILEGEYVKRDMLDQSLGGLAALFIETLNQIETSLPAKLAGKSEQEIEVELGPLLDTYRQQIVDRGVYEMQSMQDVAAHSRQGAGRPSVGAGQ